MYRHTNFQRYLVPCLFLFLLVAGCETVKNTCLDAMDSFYNLQNQGSSDRGGQRDAQDRGGQPMFMPQGVQMPFMAPVMQFQAIYGSFFYFGGYAFADDTYLEGQGTVWLIRAGEGDETDVDEIRVEKALLKINHDGSRWWALGYSDGDETIYYEALTGPNFGLKKLRFKDEETGEIREYNAGQSNQPKKERKIRSFSEKACDRYKKGKRRITVKAGTFNTDYIVIEEPGSTGRLEWWVSSKVPGRLVKYVANEMENNGYFSAELAGTGKGYTTKLHSF